MAYQTNLLEQKDGIAELTLNRPQSLNAMSAGMVGEMIDALDRLRDEKGARALLLTGAGRGFSSGADLGADLALGADLGRLLKQHFNPLIERLLVLPMPIFTAINGVAAGAGCSVALWGDIVLAGRSAYFLQAFINLALVPDAGATWLLPRLVGRARALAMMMLGDRLPAETAADWGLIYRAVDDDALLSVARQIARQFAQGPTRAYALIRQGLRQAMEASLSETLAMEREHQRLAGRTRFAEGVAAFQAKRKPVFSGE